jgi:hypothetical protein
MNNYFGRIRRLFKTFYHSFSRDFVPPNSTCTEPTTLTQAITECSTRGRLLVLNLTLHDHPVPVSLQPSDDYLVYTSPYTARATYPTARLLSVSSLPSIGIFFCPSRSPDEIQFLESLQPRGDVRSINRCIGRFHDELLKRRRRAADIELSNSIRNDQDQELEQALRDQKAKEAAREREEEEKVRKREEKIKTAKLRYSALTEVSAEATPEEIIG